MSLKDSINSASNFLIRRVQLLTRGGDEELLTMRVEGVHDHSTLVPQHTDIVYKSRRNTGSDRFFR